MLEWVFYTNLGGTAEVTGFCPFYSGQRSFLYPIDKLTEIIQNKSKARLYCKDGTVTIEGEGANVIKTEKPLQVLREYISHIEKLRTARVDAVLIGETLMRSNNKKEALKSLNGSPL